MSIYHVPFVQRHVNPYRVVEAKIRKPHTNTTHLTSADVNVGGDLQALAAGF
jgi:hypothetical protein